MGKFDGPHFQCDECLVSVWVAKRPISEIPKKYFAENYEGEDDEPFNQFSQDFGFGYYDHDFVEGAGLKTSSPVAAIISSASYGNSFCQAVGAASAIKNTEHVFLMYNFRYDPIQTGVTESDFYKFVGVFAYSRND